MLNASYTFLRYQKKKKKQLLPLERQTRAIMTKYILYLLS